MPFSMASNSDIKVTIRAVGSNAEKGKALEYLAGAVWIKLGYRGVLFNTYKTGEEVDVIGTHIVSGEVLKGQCKAYQKPIGAPPLKTFFGDLQKERGHKPHTTGIFISLSGFTGTAIEWYNELSSEHKEWFKLLDKDQFLSHLFEANLIQSQEMLLEKWKAYTKLQISNLCLLATERGPFWMADLSDGEHLDAYYFFSAGCGTIPREEDLEYLGQRVTRPSIDTRRVRLQGREKIITLLLQNEEKALADLARDSYQSIDDVSAAIASLQADGLVIINSDYISLHLDVGALIQLVRMCLDSPNELIFMQSSYYTKAKDLILIPLIEARFFIQFDESERQPLLRLLSLSASALRRAMLGTTELYQTGEQHLKSLQLNDEDIAKYKSLRKTNFLQDVYRDLLIDHEEQRASGLESMYNIKLVKGYVKLKIATIHECFLRYESQWTSLRANIQPGQDIKAGQLLFAPGPGAMMEAASALMAMEEFDEAIEEYDTIAHTWPGTDEAYAAINNKGLCLINQGKLKEAEEQFNAVTNIPIARKAALTNLAEIYSRRGNQEYAKKLHDTIQTEYGDQIG